MGLGAAASPAPEGKASWKLPCGIFLTLLFVVLLTGGIFASIYFLLNNSEANKVAQAGLRQDPSAREALGEIESFGLPWGSISTSSGGTGEAAFSLSVTGSKNSGKFFATLKKENDLWVMTSGRLVLKDGRTVPIPAYDPQRTKIRSP